MVRILQSVTINLNISGKYKNALGTYMFFEEDPCPQSEDPLFDKLPDNNLKYVCKTKKFLKMDHAYVLSKEGQGTFLMCA